MAAPQTSQDRIFTVMLSAGGRRVALMRLLRDSIQDLGLTPRILVTDLTPKSAAFQLADIPCIVKRHNEPGCLDQLLDLCRQHQVRLVVPTIDPELPFYARHRTRFESVGARVVISSQETIQICNDKRSTHQWLTDQGFPTLRQIDADLLLEDGGCKTEDGAPSSILHPPSSILSEGWTFPVFVKPIGGSSSIGARIVRDPKDLAPAISDGQYIAQEIAPGQEYTTDVFVDQNGKCRCAVPRLRFETRGGEVSKGMAVRCAPVEDVARRVAEALPGARGVLNVQSFFDEATGALNVIEINPRFGGGYPLSHQAGAPMTQWVIEEALGVPSTARDDQWRDGVVMLRYDDAVFVHRDQI
jgi:carbamoyl-phosphate synthase large subunit